MTYFRAFGFLLVLVLLAVFLQETLLRFLLPYYLIPNLLVVIVVFLAFFRPEPMGAVMAFTAGLLYDFASGVLLGPWAAASVILFGLISMLTQRIFVGSYMAGFLAVSISTIIANIVYLAMIKGFLPSTTQIVSISVAEALVSGVVAPPLFALLRKTIGEERMKGRGFGGSFGGVPK